MGQKFEGGGGWLVVGGSGNFGVGGGGMGRMCTISLVCAYWKKTIMRFAVFRWVELFFAMRNYFIMQCVYQYIVLCVHLLCTTLYHHYIIMWGGGGGGVKGAL